MAQKSIKKSKMTLDKLAQMTQREFLHLNGEIAEIRENMATKEDVNKILTAVDGIASKHQSFEVEMAANLGAHDRLGKKIDGHEVRIKKLELPA